MIGPLFPIASSYIQPQKVTTNGQKLSMVRFLTYGIVSEVLAVQTFIATKMSNNWHSITELDNCKYKLQYISNPKCPVDFEIK